MVIAFRSSGSLEFLTTGGIRVPSRIALSAKQLRM
jgi:hypothetical protein